MLFQTQEFLLLFLPAVVLGYYLLARFPAARITWLIAAGLVFYGWWDVRFLPLLVIQSLVSWGAVQAYFATGRTSNWIITLAIAANLCVLVFFKYLNFLTGAVAAAGGYTFAPYDILLPIGISFYTFEIVSYLADVRWHGAPRYPLQKFLLFVMLFPRLIAGPIVRHHEIIPQFDLPPLRDGLYQRVSKGAIWLTAGLAKKCYWRIPWRRFRMRDLQRPPKARPISPLHGFPSLPSRSSFFSTSRHTPRWRSASA